jgi:CDP-diacylglycerol--glycerol-3-phosphate 3-phosphatidyltransferase
LTFWPVVQAGVLGVKEEERALGKVFEAVKTGHGKEGGAIEVDLTSGYFGLYKAYKKAVIESPAPVRIIAASPKVSWHLSSRDGWLPMKGWTS